MLRASLLWVLGLALATSGCGGSWPYWPWSPSDKPLHAEPPPGTWHVVKEGETLATLSEKAAVPVEDLREINGLAKGQEPKAGQLLFLLGPDKHEQTKIVGATEVPRRGPGSVTNTEHRPQAREDGRLAWPVARPLVSSTFGDRWGRHHEGIDLSAPLGTAVFAADDGVVIYSDNLLSGYGNMIIIEHRGGLLTAYAHNSVLMAQRGDKVRRGQPIARVGQSGRATAPHLHFEVRLGDEPRDPLQFLPPLK